MKLFIALLLISSSSFGSLALSQFKKGTRTHKLRVKSALGAYASSDLTEKLKLFDSDKIADIKEGFEKSLNSPTIARANFRLSISHKKNIFAYKRQYFALAQAQNPVFPQLKLTQFNDHEISYSRGLNWKNFNLLPEVSWVFRKGKIETKKAEDLMGGNFDFNPEVGSPYQFLSLGTLGTYSLEKDTLFLFSVKRISIGESIVPEQYYMFGVQKSFIFNNLSTIAKLQRTSIETWKVGLETQHKRLRANLETNNFGDLNYELSLKAFNLELSYFNLTERSPILQDLSAEVSGITLNYTYF